jgi:hypothetical protein
MKLNARCLVACLLFIGGLLSLPQIGGHEEAGAPKLPGLPPLAVGLDTAAAKPEISLPSDRYGLVLDLDATTHNLGEAELPAPKQTRPLQVGVHRPVALSPVERGQRFHTTDGTQVIVFAVTSPGAVALRLRFTDFDIAPGDEVYVRGTGEKPRAAGPYRDRGMHANGEFWSATIEGDTAVVEYHVRSRVGSFVLAEVSHLYQPVTDGPPSQDVLACQVDASCSSVGPKNAVGRILFSRTNGSYVCSGTLLNNSNNDRTPYFLTANHCISTAAEAASIEAFWAYQTTACNSNVVRSDWAFTDGGATLLVGSASQDSSLLRFNNSVPPVASFAGWNAAQLPLNTAVFGLHHPGGGLPPEMTSFLRRSIGTITNLSGPCLSDGFRVNWNSGTTEGGSSGSGLFVEGASSPEFVGVLSCGPTATCTGSFDFYGRFANFYHQVASYLTPPPPPAAAKADFNADSKPDLLWQNNSTGQRAIWLMNGTTWAGERFLPTVAVQWQIAGSGDFNSDGHTDIVWQNTATGQRAVWLMSGTTWVSERFLPTVGTDWQIAGTGHFNSDSQVDLIWQNSVTGQRAIWLMNGTTWIGERFLPNIPVQWQIAATGDFNADQQTDIVWQNTATGQRAVWLMNGSTWVSERFLPAISTQWQIAGAADFNSDSQVDIVWQNTANGQRAVWLMEGTSWVGERFLPTVPTEWEIRNR